MGPGRKSDGGGELSHRRQVSPRVSRGKRTEQWRSGLAFLVLVAASTVQNEPKRDEMLPGREAHAYLLLQPDNICATHARRGQHIGAGEGGGHAAPRLSPQLKPYL